MVRVKASPRKNKECLKPATGAVFGFYVFDQSITLTHFQVSTRRCRFHAALAGLVDGSTFASLLIFVYIYLAKEQKMNYDETVKTIPERYAATVHTVIPRYEDEGMAWGYMSE